jgi:hypothetical protein
MHRDRWIEIGLIASFAAIVSFQVFVPPSLGMANNGDFGRMIGRFALGPWHPEPSDEYAFLTTAWIFDRSYHWVSDNFSSELFPISTAVLIGWFFNGYHFDIRAMGAVHALLWIGCFAVFVIALRPMPGWSRWITAGAALVILTDANYVAFCNSFYMDAAAFLFLGWAIGLWLIGVVSEEPATWPFVGFSITSALCLMSKLQHAPLALPLFALAVFAAFQFAGRRRLVALSWACLVPLAGITEYLTTPAYDARQPQYSVVFLKILDRSHSRLADLKELNLPPEYAGYTGRGRPSLTDPKAEDAWWDDYLRRVPRSRVLAFELRHPLRTASMMYWDLKVRAPDRAMQILGKYDRESGYPAQAQAQMFGWWTALRSALFRLAPWHILVWFGAALAISARLAMRGGAIAKAAILNLALCTMAILEFAISSLSDAGETERHLFVFHVLTDFTILCAIAWLANLRYQRYSAMRPSGPTAHSEPSGATLSAL